MGKRKKTGNDLPSTPPPTGTETSQRVNPEAPAGIASPTSISTALPTAPSSPPSTFLATSSVEAGPNVQQISDSNPTTKTAEKTKTETPPPQQKQPSVIGAIASVPPEGFKAQSGEMVKSPFGNVSDNTIPKSDVSKTDKEPQVQEISNQIPQSAIIVKEIQEKLSMSKPVSPQNPLQEQKFFDANTTLENTSKLTANETSCPITTKSDTVPQSPIPVQLPVLTEGEKKPVPENPIPSQTQKPKDIAEATKDSVNQEPPPLSPLQSPPEKPPTIVNIQSASSGTSKTQNLLDKRELPKSESGKQSPAPFVKVPDKVSADKPNPQQKIPFTNVGNSPSADPQKVTVEKKDPLPLKEKSLQNQDAKLLPENKTPISPLKQVAEEKNSSKGAVDKKKSESPQGEKPSQIPVPMEKTEKNATKQISSQDQVSKETGKSNGTKAPVSAEGSSSPSLMVTTENKASVPVTAIADKKEATGQPSVTKNVNDQTKSQNEKPPAFSSQKKSVAQQPVEVGNSTERSVPQKPALTETTQKPKDIKPKPSNTSESHVPVQQQTAKVPSKPPTEIPAAQSETKLESYSEKVNKSNKTSTTNQVAAENKEIQKTKGENKIPEVAPNKNDKTEKKELEQKAVEASSPKDKNIPASAGKGAQPKTPLPHGTDTAIKEGTKVIPAQTQAKKGNKPEVKAANPQSETPKPKTEGSTPSNEVPAKKENAGSTKKDVSEKISDSMPKKSDPLSRTGEHNASSSKQNASKGKDVVNAQSENTSKPSNDTELPMGSLSDTPQGQPQKLHKQPEVLGEVKIDDVNNKEKGKTPENKTAPKKPPTATKTKTEETTQKSGPAASNEAQEGNASKKAKNKKPKQKGADTGMTKPASNATKENQPITTVESGNKDKSKASVDAKSPEPSNLLGLVQEVIEGIGKQGSSSQVSAASVEKGANDTESKSTEEVAKKSKRSRNRKKPKAKEGQDSQEKCDNKEAFKVQDKQGDATKVNEQQKKKPEGEEGKSGNKTKKEKVKKEGTSQSGDKQKQNPPRNKTNQSSAADVGNVALSSNDPKTEDGTSAIDSKELQGGQNDDQPKKKRKRRKNKGKQPTNEGEKEIGEGTENIAPTSEATAGIKKNSNESKVTENSIGNSGIETTKKTSNKKYSDAKFGESKQNVSAKLTEEQLTHITRTAVNLSQSLGDPDKINLKFTPDLMQSLLAPKPTDIVSSTEDEGEIEYRLVQRQIFLSFVCHVCKSLDSKTCSLKKCNSCKLISYCSKKHQKDHWSAHKDMCTAITAICKRDNLSHLFEKAKGLSPNDFRLYRTHFVNMCAQELGRNLQLWEKEMIYYPQVCHSCYECDMQKLINCQNCNHVSYCNAQHRKADHDIWCKQFLVYRDITLHQFHNGMIKPVIPDKMFKEHVPLTGNMTYFLSKAYEITENSVQMSKLHFVVLTEVATCPFTVLYSLDICGFPLKDAEVLTVHLVGAEVYFEIDNIRKWELLLLHLVPTVKVLKLVFVGPELNIDNALMKSFTETKVCQGCKTAGRNVSYEFFPGFYHDFVSSEKYEKPDLICAFNSGLYRPSDYQGMDSWSPTIEAMFRTVSIPVVVTEYTDQELPLDIARVQSINNSVDIIMPPTRNPFSSSKPSLNFLSEEKVPVIFKNYCITIMRRKT